MAHVVRWEQGIAALVLEDPELKLVAALERADIHHWKRCWFHRRLW